LVAAWIDTSEDRTHSTLPHSATMSLDGFIVGADGDMSWLTEHLASGPAIDELPDEHRSAAHRRAHVHR
jgi:hypothetical protein